MNQERITAFCNFLLLTFIMMLSLAFLYTKSGTSYFAIAIVFCTVVLNCPGLFHKYIVHPILFSIDQVVPKSQN